MCSMVKLTFLISVFYLSIIYISIHIYILHTSKLICITMRLWIFLSTDNVLTLQQSGTGGHTSKQLVEIFTCTDNVGAVNLRNVNYSCHGSVLVGGYIICVPWSN